MRRFTAETILRRVMEPHTHLAIEFLKRVRIRHTFDPTYRNQIAGIIVFLAGVDKMLGLALQLLYLSGHVRWNWLKPRHTEAGLVGCGPGMHKKIAKLRELGLDVKYLDDLIELRNYYVHATSIGVGYRVDVSDAEPMRASVRAYGPEIVMGSEPPLFPMGPRDLRRMAATLTMTTAKFLESKDWHSGWQRLTARVAELPVNPNSIEERIAGGIESNELLNEIEKLNRTFIGEGLRLIIQ